MLPPTSASRHAGFGYPGSLTEDRSDDVPKRVESEALLAFRARAGSGRVFARFRSRLVLAGWIRLAARGRNELSPLPDPHPGHDPRTVLLPSIERTSSAKAVSSSTTASSTWHTDGRRCFSVGAACSRAQGLLLRNMGGGSVSPCSSSPRPCTSPGAAWKKRCASSR